MATFKVTKEAYIQYSLTTWQGEIEFEGEKIAYRFSEDENGQTLYILDGYNWVEADGSKQAYAAIFAACNEWGNPEELGSAGEEVEIDDELIEDYI
jgi:hypothetical protein